VTRAATLLLGLSIVISSSAAGQTDAVFDGVWEGTIEVVDSYGVVNPTLVLPEGDPSAISLRLEVHGSAVTITLGNDPRQPIGGYHIQKYDAAALVYSNVAADNWIETYQYSLTKTKADTVLVFVWRVVNNTLLRPERDRSKFAWGAVGQLQRTPSRAGASN
jgi:hypothetical protein